MTMHDYTLLCEDAHYSSKAATILLTLADTNDLLQLRSGSTELQAMDRAAAHPTLQLLEFHYTNPLKLPAHLCWNAFSQKAADRLQSAQYIELGVPGEFCIRLTPRGLADATWQYAVVSSPSSKMEDYGQAGMLLKHFTRLTQTAAATCERLRKTPRSMWS